MVTSNSIDYQAVIRLSGDQGLRGNRGLTGESGEIGTSITLVYQRKSGTVPNLPEDNDGMRNPVTPTILAAPPPTWSLTDPGPDTQILYAAVAILPGGSMDIDWQVVLKLSGEQGLRGDPGNDGNDGSNGYSTRLIYRKTTAYDLLQTPAVTYSGTRPPNENSLTLPNEDWSILPYSSRSFDSFTLNASNNSPQSLDYDEETDILFVINAAGVASKIFRYNNEGLIQTPNSFDLHTSNDNPIDLTVNGNLIRVLDGNRREDLQNPGTYFYKVFAYSKSDGGRQESSDFNITTTGAGLPQGISLYGDKIYILTATSVRVFDLTGTEQAADEGLSSLGSSNTDPEGLDIDHFYLIYS